MAMIHSSSKTIIVFIVSTGLLGTAVLLTTMKTALRASNPEPFNAMSGWEIFFPRCQTILGESTITL